MANTHVARPGTGYLFLLEALFASTLGERTVLELLNMRTLTEMPAKQSKELLQRTTAQNVCP